MNRSKGLRLGHNIVINIQRYRVLHVHDQIDMSLALLLDSV